MDPSEYKERYETCIACPRFFKPTRQCKECKCFMPLKVRIPSQNCPIGKW